MDKKVLAIGSILIMIGIVTATTFLFIFPYQPDQPPKANDANSSQEGILEVVNANNQFAFELYSELNKVEGNNMFYSPYSISTAIAMTYEGARGKTADEMKSVFHYPEKEILRSNSAAIYNNLNKVNKAYELMTGNALWVQEDCPFLEEYKSNVEEFYGGKAAVLNFITETEKSRLTINSFIEEQTNGKIKNLIPRNKLKSSVKLVITNAIYFKGDWEWKFDKSDTVDQDFKITPEEVVRVPMMHMAPDKTEFNYVDMENLQILELPYKGEEISMLILLPKENLESIDSDLNSEKLEEWKSQMQKTKLDKIYLPKFEFDSKYFMKETLIKMGMPTAFGDTADFSGMTSAESLKIGSVIHQAYVKVDEEGTEAAAATAVIMVTKSSPMPGKVFRADHPFIFLIQEKETGNILFLGRVTDPTVQ